MRPVRSSRGAAPTSRLLVDGRDVGPLELARTARDRSRGLLGRAGISGALWLEPAKQVHTLRMRFPLDVAHVARDGTVLAVTAMPPNRWGRLVWRSRAVVEAEAGAFDRWGLGPGSRLEVG